MPLYTYSCDSCGHEFEAFVTQSHRQPDEGCPSCHRKNLTKVLSLPAKGSTATTMTPTNCRGDGPPCGAAWCGRQFPQ
jgi:putative FmdB family regulatory protein